MRRNARTLYLMLQDRTAFVKRYTYWKSLKLTEALLDAAEAQAEDVAEVAYARDIEGRALAQAYLEGARSVSNYVMGFTTLHDEEVRKSREEIPLDFNVDEYRENALEMPGKLGQQKG